MSVGVCINTYNREATFQECFNSLPRNKIDELVVVKDGGKNYNCLDKLDCTVLDFPSSNSIATSKNAGLAYLMHKKCEHIFLIEDDIAIKKDTVFDAYIDTGERTGIYHLLFSKIKDNPIIETYDGIDLHKKCQGAFTYMLRGIIKNIGGLDQKFINALEHVDWTYRCGLAGLVPPFWYFADMHGSENYLEEIQGSESTISHKENYIKNLQLSVNHWFTKHQVHVKDIPMHDMNYTRMVMDKIKINYSKAGISARGFS